MVNKSIRLRASSPAASASDSGGNSAPKTRKLVAQLGAESDLWATGIYASSAERALRTVIGPIVLLVAAPLFVNVAALAAKHHDSDLLAVLADAGGDATSVLRAAFPLPSLRVALVVAFFVALQLALFTLLPGKMFPGARAPSGFVPKVSAPPSPSHIFLTAFQFKRNGVPAFAITGALFVFAHFTEILPGEFIYDNLLQIMTLLNMTAVILALLLFIKGVYSPSTPDHGSSEYIPFRIYWGEELYPSVLGLDLKHFIICRIGMMSWWLFTMSFVFASVRHNGAVTPTIAASAALNILYVFKFSFFEVPGYLSAADIAVDRFGFMLCWGTIAFMPLVHNLQTLHLVKGSGLLPLSWAVTAIWITIGVFMIALNYDSDTQRHRVRSLNGNCLVWGRPARVIPAFYRDCTGTQHRNLLLACGYHGIVRHFHYLPDIILLFLYCAPAGFTRLLPFTYFFYLTGLLIDRCQRIDRRCQAKYCDAWMQYAAVSEFVLQQQPSQPPTATSFLQCHTPLADTLH